MTLAEKKVIADNLVAAAQYVGEVEEDRKKKAAKKVARKAAGERAALVARDRRARKEERVLKSSAEVVKVLDVPYVGNRLPVVWVYDDDVYSILRRFYAMVKSPLMERAVIRYASQRLVVKELSVVASVAPGAIDFERKPNGTPKDPTQSRLFLMPSIVAVLDVLAAKYSLASRSAVLACALRELALAELPPVVESSEAKWERSERALARKYGDSKKTPRQREKRWEVVNQYVRSVGKTLEKALKTPLGQSMIEKTGLSSRCSGLVVGDDFTVEGGKTPVECGKDPAKHLCPDCHQRFCDTCFWVTPEKPEGECPNCDES